MKLIVSHDPKNIFEVQARWKRFLSWLIVVNERVAADLSINVEASRCSSSKAPMLEAKGLPL